MFGTRAHGGYRWLTMGLVALFVISLAAVTPPARAASSLVVGGTAVIADANGDAVRLRASADAASAVLGEFPEGTAVFVVDGPLSGPDGDEWYLVAVEGRSGYMAARFLSAGAAPAHEVAEPESAAEPAVEEPAEQPAAEVQAAEGPLALDRAITGSALIVNTGGDPIRCRADASTSAAILGLFYEGNSVSLRGSPVGPWQPVRCAGQNGWVFRDFIGSAATPTPEPSPATTGSGTIAGTNGAGVNCRAKASATGSVITVLNEGAAVALRGARKGDWQPVTCAGQKGYVFADFVATGGTGGNDGGGSTTSGSGVVVNTNGDGVRCRDKASFSSNVITLLVEGNSVAFRGAIKGEWQPVVCAGKNGFVHKDYVKSSDSAGGGGGGGGGNDGGATLPFSPGDLARVSGTGGMGVRLRSGRAATSSVIMVVAEGERVDVRTGSKGDWVAVVYRGTNGFIHKDFLAPASDVGADPEPNQGLSSGEHARVTARVNFREGPSFTAPVFDAAPEGAVVLVTGNRTDGFYPVNWGGADGYIHGDYLVWTDEPLSGSDPGGFDGGDAGSGSSNATGDAMVDYAMGYLGYPYIWATAGPNSFDCSGFTYWVTKHVIGDDIGRGLWTQVVAGRPVSYGDLQPGDLVFFQNTYTWGLSHVGIYIGNNQFIHAENEDTGVRISSLTSTYYSTRYYGAVRLS